MNRNEEQSQPKFEDARYTAEYNAKPAIKAEVNKAALLCGSSDKAVAYAANPTDWKHAVSKWGAKGDIAGSDVSGTVVEVGSKVKGFEIGDVVSSRMHGNYTKTRGAFSDYVIADLNSTIKYDKSTLNSKALEVGDHIANSINTFEGAASITLGLVTVGLSFNHNLGIRTDKQANASRYILIWGGATATGVLAIQVAKLAYGLKVITTASSKHHDFLRSLGADEVFDYHDSNVIEQIKKAGGANINYALDTVSNEQTFQSVYDATANTNDVTIDNLLFLRANQIKTDDSRKVSFQTSLASCVDGKDLDLGGLIIPSSPELIREYNDFWFNVIPQYIPKLRHSSLKVLKSGLQTSNEALELLRQSKMSGQKVVFRAN